MRVVKTDPGLAVAEEEVKALFDLLPPARELGAFPREIEGLLSMMCCAQVEHVRELTLGKIAERLREAHHIEFDLPESSRDTAVRGYLVASGPYAAVFVETRYGQASARFGVAHEMGHLWLEHLKRRLRGESGSLVMPCNPSTAFNLEIPDAEYPAQERAANAFAAELLMPYRDVRDVVEREFGIGDYPVEDVVEGLRARYGVSEWAAQRRLLDLGLISAKVYRTLRKRSLAGAETGDLHGIDEAP